MAAGCSGGFGTRLVDRVVPKMHPKPGEEQSKALQRHGRRHCGGVSKTAVAESASLNQNEKAGAMYRRATKRTCERVSCGVRWVGGQHGGAGVGGQVREAQRVAGGHAGVRLRGPVYTRHRLVAID